MVTGCERSLDVGEREQFLAAIESSSAIETLPQFRQWVRTQVRAFFPHTMLACGVGRITENGIRIHEIVEVDFPPGYIREITAEDGLVRSPIMLKWTVETKPQLFNPDINNVAIDPSWFAAFKKYRLRNIAAHGMRNLSGSISSYFSFSGISETLTSHHGYKLEVLVPHLHTVLTRALALTASQTDKDETLSKLTQRERDVFKLMREGRTNFDIAQNLGLSANTIKNHVRSILIKLDVNNRTQAVLKASEMQVYYSE